MVYKIPKIIKNMYVIYLFMLYNIFVINVDIKKEDKKHTKYWFKLLEIDKVIIIDNVYIISVFNKKLCIV